MKDKKIKTKPIDKLFEVFNTDRTKNGEVIRFAPLESEIKKHKKHINIAVMDLNSMDMFWEYDWLVKYNPEVNWNSETICLQDAQRNVEHDIEIYC